MSQSMGLRAFDKRVQWAGDLHPYGRLPWCFARALSLRNRADQVAHLGALLAGQVVRDDDIALAQFRDENLCDIGLEGLAVDRPIEYPLRDEATQGQGANEGHCFPLPMRHAHLQSFTARTTAMAPRHIRRSPCFVNENEARRIEARLLLARGLALRHDIRAILFGGERSLFYA